MFAQEKIRSMAEKEQRQMMTC